MIRLVFRDNESHTGFYKEFKNVIDCVLTENFYSIHYKVDNLFPLTKILERPRYSLLIVEDYGKMCVSK